MTPYDLLEKLLLANPEARRTHSIPKVYQYVLKAYGAIGPDGMWNEQKYLDMPSLQTIDRTLRKVKEVHGFKDEESKEMEKQFKEKFAPIDPHTTEAHNLRSKAQEAQEQVARQETRQNALNKQIDTNMAVLEVVKGYAETTGKSLEEAAKILGIKIV